MKSWIRCLTKKKLLYLRFYWNFEPYKTVCYWEENISKQIETPFLLFNGFLVNFPFINYPVSIPASTSGKIPFNFGIQSFTRTVAGAMSKITALTWWTTLVAAIAQKVCTSLFVSWNPLFSMLGHTMAITVLELQAWGYKIRSNK